MFMENGEKRMECKSFLVSMFDHNLMHTLLYNHYAGFSFLDIFGRVYPAFRVRLPHYKVVLQHE
jgi:hypothetical protein